MSLDDRDVQYLLGEMNGKMDRVLCEVQKISNKLEKLEEKIEEHDRIIERHRTYFKVIGGVITILVMFLSALITIFPKLKFWH